MIQDSEGMGVEHLRISKVNGEVGGGGEGKDKGQDTTLFYYTGHTQQKLVSRWGVG